MAKSLDDFMAELRTNAEKFEAAYRAKAAATPELYPLSIPDDNAGLWLEFFIGFVETGET